MDDDTAKYIWALKEINKALTFGLESALVTMDKWNEMEPERRERVNERVKSSFDFSLNRW